MLTRNNQNDVQTAVMAGAGKKTNTPQKVFKFCKYACLLTIILSFISELMAGSTVSKASFGIIFWPVVWAFVYFGFIWIYKKFQGGKQAYYDAVNFKDIE